MTRASTKKALVDRNSQVLKAIRYAEDYAGNDDAKFVEALNRHFQGAMQKTSRERTIPVLPTETATKSFHIYDDPRHLVNARELARHTLGGLRVIGGAPVASGEFLDCVAVGSDHQWGAPER